MKTKTTNYMTIQEIADLLRGCARDTLGTGSSAMFSEAAKHLEHYIPLATFGAKVLAEHRGPDYWDVGDVEGCWAQEQAVACGALIRRNAPCSKNPDMCPCLDGGFDYCFRVPQDVRSASLTLGVKQR